MKKKSSFIISAILAFILLIPSVSYAEQSSNWQYFYDEDAPNRSYGYGGYIGYKPLLVNYNNEDVEVLAVELKNPMLSDTNEYYVFALDTQYPDDYRAEVFIYDSYTDTVTTYNEQFEDGFILLYSKFSGSAAQFKTFLENTFIEISYNIYDDQDNLISQYDSNTVIFESFKHNKFDKQVTKATAKPNASTIVIDGTKHNVDTYLINDSNYFKLRDVAQLLTVTEKKFEVGFNSINSFLTIDNEKPYTPVGNELTKFKAKSNKSVTSKITTLVVDGKVHFVWAYNIDGNNYFKLRDISDLVGFKVDWNSALSNIEIKTK